MMNRNENLDGSLQKTSEALTRMSDQTDPLPRPGFKAALKQRILELRQKKSMPFFSWFQSLSPKFAYGGTVALVAVIILMLVLNPFSKSIPTVYAQNNFSLTAEQEDSLGIEPTTSFILESREILDIDFVKEYLQTDTNRPFTIEKIDDHHARVTFTEKLSSGQMVQFLLPTQIAKTEGVLQDRPYSWAFQVKNSFQVLSSIPGNETSGVALDAGIEVVFSHENVSVSDFEQAFSIEPKIKGHIEKNRRSLVFVPEKLAPETVYTVTIHASLHPDASTEQLGEDYSFRFETSTDLYRSARLGFMKRFINTIPSEQAQFQFSFEDYYVGNRSVNDVTFTVYRFADFNTVKTSMSEALKDTWRSARPLRSYVPIDTLESVGTFKPEIVEESYYPLYQIPFPLEEGYYGILASWEGQEAWAYLQSTTISATLVEADGSSLLWAHDTTAKSALVGAQISTDSVSATTDSQGMARLALPEGFRLLQVQAGNRVLLLPSTNGSMVYGGWWGWWGAQTIVDDDYIGYIYSDRPVYKQGDTVHVWGFLKARDGQKLPTQTSIRVTTQFYGYEYAGMDKTIEYARLPISMTSDGIFSGDLRLPDASTGSYSLGVFLDDKSLVSRTIQLQEYRKPVYFMEFDVKEPSVIDGEEVHYTVAMKYFDGTPVSGKQIILTPSGKGKKIVTLDEQGTASGSIAVSSYYSNIGQVGAELDEPGFVPVIMTDSVVVYPSSIYLMGQAKVKNGVGSAQVDARTIHVTDSVLRDEDYKTPRPGTNVEVVVMESYYTKISLGSSYDFVRKTVYENYRYDHNERQVDKQILIADQNGKASMSFAAPNKDSQYYLILSAQDDQNRGAQKYVYPDWDPENVGRSFSSSYENALRFQVLNKDDQGNDKNNFLENEQVRLEVQQFGERFNMPETGTFLFMQAQRGIQEYHVSSTSDYTFPFESKDIPNIYVFGVLFTGSGYVIIDDGGYYTSGRYIGFDTESRKLTIDIKTDAASYKPGSDVDVQVRVSDQDGKPVAASVNVSVVDEAFFAVYPETPDPLSSLYHSLPSGIQQIVASHEQMKTAEGAEGGGGGNGEVRSNFQDTAAFNLLTTGSNGEGHTTVKLPDNVTSWRLTVHAMNEKKIQAGVNTAQVAATLPFFINAAIQPTYLTEDQPEIIVNAQGTGVKLDDAIEYQISVKGTSIKNTVKSTVGKRVSLPLTNLPEGPQTILITAKTGNKTDAISQVVDIVTSRLTIPVIEASSLNTSGVLNGSDKGLTWLTFLDGNQGKFYSDLLRLSWRYGDRADESVVRPLATELLNTTFASDLRVPEIDASAFQQADGGIRLLAYADPDPILTAKISLFGHTPFDEERMQAYLLGRLYSTNSGQQLSLEEAAWVYAGLAGLKTPILAELKRFEQQPLSQDAQLAVAIAHVTAGDVEGGRVIYQSLMQKAKRDIGYVWVERDTPETSMEMNAGLLVLASVLNEVEDREGLQNYLDRQATGQTLVVLEKLLALKSALAFSRPGASEVTYTLRGETKSEKLEKGQQFTLAVSPDELASLSPVATQGDVSVISAFQRPISTLPETYAKIGVQRRFMNENKVDASTFKAGDMVLVQLKYTIDPALPDEYFQITDSVPSGLTPVTFRGDDQYHSSCVSYPETDTDQTLSFFRFSGWTSPNCPPNTIQYYARVMNTGSFKAEPASIRAVKDPTLINYSHVQSITITP